MAGVIEWSMPSIPRPQAFAEAGSRTQGILAATTSLSGSWLDPNCKNRSCIALGYDTLQSLARAQISYLFRSQTDAERLKPLALAKYLALQLTSDLALQLTSEVACRLRYELAYRLRYDDSMMLDRDHVS